MNAIKSTLDRPDDPAARSCRSTSRGGCKAMVGGLDYDKSQVNLAVGHRRRRFRAATGVVVQADHPGGGPQTGRAARQGLRRAGQEGVPGRQRGRRLGGRQLRRRRSRQVEPGRRHPEVVEHGLRPDDARRRCRQRRRPGQAHGHHVRCARSTRRSCSAPRRCRCSTWPARTRPSPTTASTSDPVVVSRVTDAKGAVLYEAPNTRQRVLSEDVAQGRQLDVEPGGRERHRHRSRSSASRRPARPAPPTSTATHGSSATHVRSPARCGWVIRAPRPAS